MGKTTLKKAQRWASAPHSVMPLPALKMPSADVQFVCVQPARLDVGVTKRAQRGQLAPCASAPPSAPTLLHPLGANCTVCRVEVGVIGPHQSSNLSIQANLTEEIRVTQGCVVVAIEHRFKVDGLLGAIVKGDTQGIRPDNRKVCHLDHQERHNLAIPCKKVGIGCPALLVRPMLPVQATYSCQPLPHVSGPTVSEYYGLIMYCLESVIDATHLQKVDSAFQVLSADKAARPGQC